MVGYIFLVIVILIVLFLVFRELNCWYWKINERIDLMKEQNELLRNLVINQTKKTDKKLPPTIKKAENNTILTSDNSNIVDSTSYTDNGNTDAKHEKVPKLVKESVSSGSSIFGGGFNNIDIEYEDGLKGTIMQDLSKSTYYFLEKKGKQFIQHHYQDHDSCIEAFYLFQKNNEVVIEQGYVGSFS